MAPSQRRSDRPGEPEHDDRQDVDEVDVQEALLHPAKSGEALRPASRRTARRRRGSTDPCTPSRSPSAREDPCGAAFSVTRARSTAEGAAPPTARRTSAPCTACARSVRRSRSPRSRRRRGGRRGGSEERPLPRAIAIQMARLTAAMRAEAARAPRRRSSGRAEQLRCRPSRASGPDAERTAPCATHDEREKRDRADHPERRLVRVGRRLASRLPEQRHPDRRTKQQRREPPTSASAPTIEQERPAPGRARSRRRSGRDR